MRPKTIKEAKPQLLIGIVLLFVILGITAERLYPDTFIGELIADTIGKFFNLIGFVQNRYVTILESLTIVFFVWLLTLFLSFIIRLLMQRNQRNKTIAVIMTGILNYLMILIGLFLILGAWGVEAPTLLAGAGILGLAISFGAQRIIEDVLSGLLIIKENQFSIGDVIEIDGFRGTVKEMSIRTTKFENIMGDTKIVNNSDIRGAINTSSNLSSAICDVSIGYDEDIKKVEEIITQALPKIKEAIPTIVDGPYYRGVQSLADSAVVIRVIGYTNETTKLQTTRDLNREIKLLFDQHNVSIPFPQLVIHQTK